ncbi:MAG: hypothetical protein M1449_00680 [Candidatus Thermoplasmatota archaeon]|nr:hypothetical protein [Candidatus Thermoplasmatota archaeon]
MTDSLAPATRHQIAAWLMMAAGLLLVMFLRLLPALLAGLLVVQLVHLLAPRFVIGKLSHTWSKVLVVTLIQVVQVVGAHAPLHVTAAGKIFLAEDSASGVMGYAERTGLPAYTPNTLTTLEKLRTELEAIRREQLACDREEAELGVACIGAPIRDAEGKLVAGLSISAPADRHKPGWAEALKKAAAQTGAALGYLADA